MQNDHPIATIQILSREESVSAGQGWTMEYGFAESLFGTCFVAATPYGICSFQFVDDDAEEILASHKVEWSKADHIRNDSMAASVIRNIISCQEAKQIAPSPIQIHVKGTPFQEKVWNALLSIPSGTVVSYSELAQRIQCDKAVRAVASAIARNPVGWIIPCHRVVRSGGFIGQYHWTSERKQQLITWEWEQLNEATTHKKSL